MSSTSVPPTRRRRGRRLLDPVALTGAALVLAWLAFFAAQTGHWSRWPLGLAATGLALLAVLRGRSIARARQRELQRAVHSATERHRELELLRGVARSLLAAQSAAELFPEVARVSRLLLRAEGGALMLRAGEGDFLQVKAAEGLLEAAAGRLLPLQGSIAGWVIQRGEPARTDDMRADPRNHPVPGLPESLRSAVVVPLRSRGEVVGVIGAYNAADGSPFTPYDEQLLQALSDQVTVGLDRAAMLEDARRKELLLEDRNRALLEATELKGRFLANMSHELRTPLNAIIGFSDLMLAEEGLDPAHRDYLESISRNGKNLLELINAVLDVSRLEAGRMPVRLAPVDLRDLIRATVADTESLRSAKGQRTALALPEESLEAMADAGQVRQVLLNLLGNASKFTPQGGSVTVSAEPARVPLPVPADRAGEVPRAEVRAAVVVRVRDTGIGIPPDDLSQLFRAFSQVDQSASRQQQGSGLGLALAKQLVELHGGAIGVESAPGAGSTFWFILPVDGPVRGRGTA